MAGNLPILNVQEVQCLEGHTDRVWSAAWSPSGDALASCSGDKTVRVWAREAGPGTRWVCRAILEESHNRTVRSCEWSPDGKLLATASFDATTAIWERTGGEFECVASLEGHENEVKSVAWNAGGNLLATCSRDKSVWIWEAQPGNEYDCVSVLQGHSQDVKMVRWHPTRDLLVSASYDDTIRVWAEDGDEDDWRCVQTLSSAGQGHTSTVWGLSFNTTGDRMVSCSDDLTLKVWDTHTDPTTTVGGGAGPWKHLSTISGYHDRTIFSVDWSRVNGLIASASGDDAIRIFAEDEEQPSTAGQPTFVQVLKKEKAHSTDVNNVRWHPKDPKLLASASDDMCVKIWELKGLPDEGGAAKEIAANGSQK